MLKTLSFLADKIDTNVTWGLGGSLLLYIYNLIDEPNDIDILVAEEHFSEMNESIASIGQPIEVEKSDPFRTVYFSKYEVNGVGIDIMGGFAIKHSEGVYKLTLTKESIVGFEKVNGVTIPLCSLEDWYVLYQLIPKKQDKVILIENFFKTNGIKHPQLLEAALKQPLPLEVKQKIEDVIASR